MKSTEYLYDIVPSDIATMEYKEALKYKINAAKRLTGRLLEPHYMVRDEKTIK